MAVRYQLQKDEDMTKEQFSKILEELMEKIGDGPGSNIDALSQFSKRHEMAKELKDITCGLNESMGAIRLVLKYLIFDIEATRRERDQLRMLLEDQDD